MSLSAELKDDPGRTKFRMAALDLDGTLLQSNHKLSNKTCEYLQYLDRKGFTIIIATGRAACTVDEHVAKLNLPHPLPVVCSNGARGLMCSVQSDQTISYEEVFYKPVPQNIARATIHTANDLGYVSQYYVDERIYANPSQPEQLQLTEMYRELTGSDTLYIDDGFEEAIKKGPPSKQVVLCQVHQQDSMIESFETALNRETFFIEGKAPHIIRGHTGWFMEILHPEVNKGCGLENMCKHLGIPLSETVAFGDGDNDVEFIQMAGCGFVMKNARDVLKEAGDEIIEFTNDEEGVVKTLKRLENAELLTFNS
mmetsp:Transcript_501/g.750  ORF Transcript_501/g.750 Transcript_501/m.750 type:complete len:311 (+) Transcript_501:78-1010(+)